MRLQFTIEHLSDSTLAGREQRIAGARVRLGRRPDNDVAFDPVQDRHVSGTHAEIEAFGAGARIRDAGSHNGTYLNGERIEGPVPLNSGDTVRLGKEGPRLRVRFEPETPSPAPAPAAAPAPVAGPGPTPPPKEAVGLMTLQRAIHAATERERGKTRVLVGVVVILVLFLAASGGGLWWLNARRIRSDVEKTRTEAQEAKEQAQKAARAVGEALARQEARLEEQLARHAKELEALEGKIGAGETRVARLIVEIQERDRALGEIRKRQDLSESQRAALLDETKKKIAELNRQLARGEKDLRAQGGGTDWASWVKRFQQGIFLCVGVDPETSRGGIGTAFCIREDGLLGTNAHVVKMLESSPRAMVVQNDTGIIFEIERMAAHPGFSGVSSPDVGLIQLKAGDARFPALPMADDAALAALHIGTQLGTIGFPGELMQAYLSSVDASTRAVKSALATFKDGWIGRMTNYRMERADAAACTLLQHSASLSGGTSGSPMFTADGVVVALNNGGLDQQVVVKTADGTTISRTPSAAEIGFAVRVDELRRFWTSKKW